MYMYKDNAHMYINCYYTCNYESIHYTCTYLNEIIHVTKYVILRYVSQLTCISIIVTMR